MLNSAATPSRFVVPSWHAAKGSMADGLSIGLTDVELFLESMGPSRPREFVDWKRERREKYGDAAFEFWYSRYEEFEHRHLFSVTPQEVIDLVALGARGGREHALGEARKMDGIQDIRDMTTPPPMIFAFHVLLERLERVHRWTEYLAFHEGHPEYFLNEFEKITGIDRSSAAYNIDARGNMGGLRYRLGNSYYSGLKEVYILASLRHRFHIDARYHFLIDTEWKTDIFSGNVLIELYVGNDVMKTKDGGRKWHCKKKNKGMTVLEIESSVRKDFGKCWLIDDDGLANIAQQAIRAGCPRL